MLKASLNQTESESARMDTEKSNVLEKQTVLEKSIMTLHSKTKDIRDEIIVVTRWFGGVHLGGDRFRRVQDAVRYYLEAR